MLFFLVFSYLSLYYIRPTEWVPGIIGTPLLMLFGVMSLLFLGVGVISGKFPNMLNGQIERMMFGFVAAIALSHLSHFYIGGAINSLNLFLPTITGFFLVICFVDSRKRLNVFLMLLILLTTFLAYEGWLQHRTGFSHGGLEPYYEKIIMGDGNTVQLPRIRWYGVFNDPNDLGLVLVLVVPFLLDMLLQRRLIVPLATLPLVVVAIYYTNSRGTVLAGLVSIASYFVIRYRSLYGALAGGLFAVIFFLIGPSRMSSVSASGDSAYGRIEAWYAAYQMFKANPLFGVGQGRFTEYHILTAHNSYVLIMAELGVVGLFFFTGIIYYPYNWLWRSFFKVQQQKYTDADIGLISSVFASLTGVLTSMCFISRSYVLIPYMAVAISVSVTRHMNNQDLFQNDLKNISLLTIGQILALNIAVKVLI